MFVDVPVLEIPIFKTIVDMCDRKGRDVIGCIVSRLKGHFVVCFALIEKQTDGTIGS